MPITERDPYEVLGISRSASPEEVRKAHVQNILKHHPDRNPGDPDATRRMQDVNIAFGKIRKEQAAEAKYSEQERKVKAEQRQQQRDTERRTAPVDIARIVDKREWVDGYDDAFAESNKGFVPPKVFNQVWDMIGDLFYNKDFGYLDSAPLFKQLLYKHKVKPEWTQAVLVAMERVGILEFGGESSNPSDI